MRRPRAVFTVRWLMVAVAIVGVTIGGTIQAKRWWRLSSGHADMADRYARAAAYLRALDRSMRPGTGTAANDTKSKKSVIYIHYYEKLTEKYEQAARHPWVSVEPDPPEPE